VDFKKHETPVFVVEEEQLRIKSKDMNKLAFIVKTTMHPKFCYF